MTKLNDILILKGVWAWCGLLRAKLTPISALLPLMASHLSNAAAAAFDSQGSFQVQDLNVGSEGKQWFK